PPVLALESLSPAADGTVGLSFPVSTTTPPPLGLRVTGQGVFPVRFSVMSAQDEELDALITHLVRLPDASAVGRPLAFSLVVPFSASPNFTPDMAPAVSDADAARLGAVG